MTTEQKISLIYANPIDAYRTLIVNEDLHNTYQMLSRTAVNALCIDSGIFKSKFEIIASQQALYMMLNLKMI